MENLHLNEQELDKSHSHLKTQNRDGTGVSSLGVNTDYLWDVHPRNLLFTLSRYKFVAKMLSGKQRVLEVGCGDAFGTRIVQQEVQNVTAIDIDSVYVNGVNQRMSENWPFECKVHDILEGPMEESFDAAYSLDVLEHIPTKLEDTFMLNIARSLGSQGVVVLGSPSAASQVHAPEIRKLEHINCKTHVELNELAIKYFHNVFIFSMNDEMVHTGFYPMAHYLFALCVGNKVDVSD